MRNALCPAALLLGCVSFLSVLPSPLLLSQPRGVPSQTWPDPRSPAPLSAVRFRLHERSLIVFEGQIGKLASLKFLLDTGTTRTVISRQVASRLGLPRQRERKTTVLNFNKDVPIDLMNVPEVDVGPLRVRNARVFVADLWQFSDFADGLEAIVGLDLLGRLQNLRIDYRTGLLTLNAASTLVSQSSGPSVFTLRLPVQGQTIRLILDSGLEGMVLYKDRIRSHQGQIKLDGELSAAQQGRLDGESAQLSGIRLGADTFQASVFLLPVAPSSLASDIDGYTGLDVLHAHMIELDFESKAIRWQ